MVPPYKRLVTSSSSSSSAASRASSATSWASTAASASWESSTASSSSSSAEVPPPRKKIKLSTRRTKSITNNLSSSRKRKKSHPKSHLVEAAASPKKLKLSTSSLANKRPPLPLSWLPEGWTVVWLARPSGQKYKVFKETATGKKFYSKPQVLNYLGIADSNKRNVKVAPPQNKQVSTLSTKLLEIPERLYDLIQDAARARKSLKLNSNNMSAKRELKDYELKIHIVSAHCKCITEELPIDWIYDPETPITAYVSKPRTLPKPQTKITKKKTKKDIKITWSSPNYHGSYQLNNDEKQVWDFFKEKYTDEPERFFSVAGFTTGKYLVTVKDDMVVNLLGNFAVDTFNRSCKMYVNEDEDNQVSGAEFMECKFYKVTSMYIFYMTIEAIEQGILGVYETTVECDTEDGARTLMNFMLTDRKPKGNRQWLKPREVEYETVQDGSSDPQDYYVLTGMVHRNTEGGGFNYHNPPFAPHTRVYTIRSEEGFGPNVSQPLEFPAATETIPVDR